MSYHWQCDTVTCNAPNHDSDPSSCICECHATQATYQIESSTHQGTEWHVTEPSCTIDDLRDANAADAYVIEDLIPSLQALAVGATIIVDLGAGGVDRWTRIT